MRPLEDCRIGIVGLGYVGLPLAAEFGKRYDTLGLDIDRQRVAELVAGIDRTRELDAAQLASAGKLRFTHDAGDLRECNVYIVTVPTPIDDAKRPDLGPLRAASRALGAILA